MKTIRIGKQEDNDYVVREDTVSRYHAQMTVTDSGEVYIKDLSSTNGTFVDGKKIQAETKLMAGNVVRLGNKVINWMEIIQKGSNETKVQNVGVVAGSISGKYLVGRDEKCQIRFAQSEVSGRHAMLEKNEKGEPQITDMGSTNGTFVNGQRIFSATELHKGDVVLLANKFPLNWEQYIPAKAAKKEPNPKTKTGLLIAAAALVFLLIVGGGIGLFLKNRAWTSEKVYSTYKSSVVFIRVICHYEPMYKGRNLGTLLEDKNLVSKYVDGDDDVVDGSLSWVGSGSFVSEDGLIVTNRHVANMPAEEDARNKAKIKQDVKNYLQGVLNTLQALYAQSKSKNQRKKIADLFGMYYEIYNNDVDITVELKYDFIGVGLNDTHVPTLSDLLPCSFVKNHPDEKVDAALIQLNTKKTPEDIKIINLKDISKPQHHRLGSPLYTIGFPNGLKYGTTDIGLEANNQSGEITQETGMYEFGHNIQITGGASGSPIFDAHGRFAGLVVSGWTIGGIIDTGYNRGVSPDKVAELLK